MATSVRRQTSSFSAWITELVAPSHFVDEPVTGPFASWWHAHVFEERDGATLMTHTVEFAWPAGPVGRLVDSLVLTQCMTPLLAKRNRWLVHALS